MTTQPRRARPAPAPALIPVYRREDIPAFTSEQEEHEFWSTHSFTEELIAQLDPASAADLPPVRARRATPRKSRSSEPMSARPAS